MLEKIDNYQNKLSEFGYSIAYIAGLSKYIYFKPGKVE